MPSCRVGKYDDRYCENTILCGCVINLYLSINWLIIVHFIYCDKVKDKQKNIVTDKQNTAASLSLDNYFAFEARETIVLPG